MSKRNKNKKKNRKHAPTTGNKLSRTVHFAIKIKLLVGELDNS